MAAIEGIFTHDCGRLLRSSQGSDSELTARGNLTSEWHSGDRDAKCFESALRATSMGMGHWREWFTFVKMNSLQPRSAMVPFDRYISFWKRPVDYPGYSAVSKFR
jgi:hypothetical protein